MDSTLELATYSVASVAALVSAIVAGFLKARGLSTKIDEEARIGRLLLARVDTLETELRAAKARVTDLETDLRERTSQLRELSWRHEALLAKHEELELRHRDTAASERALRDELLRSYISGEARTLRPPKER